MSLTNPQTVSIDKVAGLTETIQALQADINALRQNYGFNYYQVAVPASPKLGERWAELATSGEILDEWNWNGSCWVKSQELIAASEQRNLTSFPANNWWGYVNTKYNIWINKLIFDTTLSTGFVAGNTYYSAAFAIGGCQQLGPAIDTVNQSFGIGANEKSINKLFLTSVNSSGSGQGHMFSATISKIGTGTVSPTLFCAVAVAYQQARK
jgi:hypothetical protein